MKSVVMVTTDKCYQNNGWYWGYRENEPMGGDDPYSSSKGCAELVTHAMRHSYFHPGDYQKHGVAIASARAGNAIGGGDWSSDRLITDIFAGLIAGKKIEIRNPNATRPWQYVLEPLRGYLMLAKKLYEEGPKFSEGWNFGPDDSDSKPVSYIIERLIHLWGEDGVSWCLDGEEQPHEAPYLKLDCSKSKARLSWTPHWSIDQALEATVAWYKSYQEDPENLKTFTLSQIENYHQIAEI